MLQSYEPAIISVWFWLTCLEQRWAKYSLRAESSPSNFSVGHAGALHWRVRELLASRYPNIWLPEFVEGPSAKIIADPCP